MDRVDSGFGDSRRAKAPEMEATTAPRSSMLATRQPQPRRTKTDPGSNAQTTDSDAQQPLSDKRSRRPSRQPRISTDSSENSTAKSRAPGRGSKPSSRRTSCTIVDPSRPTRHYRIKSSHTVPSVNQDMDDVLALHFRSCSLFSNPSYHSSSGLPNAAVAGHAGASGVDTDITSHTEVGPVLPTTSSTVTQYFDTDSNQKNNYTMRPPFQGDNTVTEWLSPSTRKKEYEKIDRANSGFRGFVRRITPRCVSGTPPPKFYENDQSESGSVRRYRMDVSDGECEEGRKSTDWLHEETRIGRLEKKESTMPTENKKKRWGCF